MLGEEGGMEAYTQMRRILKKERREKWPRQESGYLFPYTGFIESHFAFKAYTKIPSNDVQLFQVGVCDAAVFSKMYFPPIGLNSKTEENVSNS